MNKTGVYYVTKNGLELLPAVKPPTKQAEKALRRNESTPHLNTPIEDLPHLVNGPLGPGGSGGIGDEFMAVSVPNPSPSPAPVLLRALLADGGGGSKEEDEKLVNSILVVDSAIETVKANPPNTAIFGRLLGERRQRRLGSTTSFSSSSSGLKPLLGMLASPKDMVEAFKGAYQAGDGEHEEKPKEVWPEYIYAKKRNTKCFLCGLQPLPSSSHVNPNDDRTCWGGVGLVVGGLFSLLHVFVTFPLAWMAYIQANLSTHAAFPLLSSVAPSSQSTKSCSFSHFSYPPQPSTRSGGSPPMRPAAFAVVCWPPPQQQQERELPTFPRPFPPPLPPPAMPVPRPTSAPMPPRPRTP